MKKLFCALGIVLLLAGVAFAEFPAPFESAKRIAMGNPAKDGVYQWTIADPNLSGIIYVIGYRPTDNALSLIVIDEDNKILTALTLINGHYIREVAMGPFLIEQKELTESEALEIAFGFFRNLVSLNLI